MRGLACAAMGVLLCAQAPLCAQERESKGKGGESHEAFWGWANFLLLAGGLGYAIKKNAGPYFAQRSLEIRKGMVEAEAARAGAEARMAEVDRRLANLGAEIEALRRDARQEAEADGERVRREAAAEMAKVQAHLADEIAAASKSARLELRRYSAGLALELAERKIAARLTPETQDRLVKVFVASMAHAGRGPSGN